jgi:hypothetical protein
MNTPTDPPFFYATCGDDLIEFALDLDDLLDRVAGVHEAADDVVVWRQTCVLMVLTGDGRRIDVRDTGPERLRLLVGDVSPALHPA